MMVFLLFDGFENYPGGVIGGGKLFLVGIDELAFLSLPQALEFFSVAFSHFASDF
jgi:hypothetical protein